MATTEHTINDALAEVLRHTRRTWRNTTIVRSENTEMLKGNSGRPDILVIEPHVSPVVIETEVLPALSVEAEAISRLGHQLRTTGRKLLSSIAVRLPIRLRNMQASELQNELATAKDIEMALYTGEDESTCLRWPRSGWVQGRVADLSILVQSASIPPNIIDEAANQLVIGVSEAAGMLGEMTTSYPGAIHNISKALYQEDNNQTHRMAATILANAFIFHESLAGGSGQLAQVNSIEQIKGSRGGLTKSAILTEWRKILSVNYWPIFEIARRILEIIPTSDSQPLIESLARTSRALIQNRLMRSHDLTGAVFQRLIADRKFLAAYYTTPASASLLVGLAITPEFAPNGGFWSNANNVTNLRLADFACGTGTLLTTTYQRVSQLHELAGGNIEALHPTMMANVLVGCDVLPAAAHLTASMLAGAHPTIQFSQSSIMTIAYGQQPNGHISLGSLDLLSPQGVFEILDITAKVAEGTGETEKQTGLSLPHGSFDLVIMNPPFTRPTVHEADRLNIPNPMFAAFGTTSDVQALMAKATESLIRGTSANGNAGEASMFLLLAHRKIKQGGTLALVMPLSMMAGDAWEDSRLLLANNYSDLILVSIAGAGSTEMSFSADTGMAECLFVGRKSGQKSKRATFVILKERPSYPLLGTNAANQIHQLIAQKNIRHLEDGPVGGSNILSGDEVIGYAMEAPLPASGGWNLARISDLSLAQTAYQLASNNTLWLPTMNRADASNIPITLAEKIGKIGPIHRDINGTNADGSKRGPFDTRLVNENEVPTYPVLWAHNAKRERTMQFEADYEGVPRSGKNFQEQKALEAKIASVWDSASHCHFNCDFQFNSQSTGMQYTSRKTIGGRAWLSITLPSPDYEKALVLWANTSLGILLRWWHSNKQQAGRGNIGKSMLQTLPVFDITSLTPQQIEEAVKIFSEFKSQPLLPVHEIDKDVVRRNLDEEFAKRILYLPPSIYQSEGPMNVLRLKLSREPSIRGLK